MSSSRVSNRLTLLVGMAAMVGLSCSAPNTIPGISDGFLALGTWGGDSGAMMVGDTDMHLHIACTFGDVSGRIPVNADGSFDVAGSYVLRAYPIAYGPSLPARFVGFVTGPTATVKVNVNDTVMHQMVERGPVIVRLGDQPRLMPCPVCRRPIRTGILGSILQLLPGAHR
jgi:hypothetical protein